MAAGRYTRHLACPETDRLPSSELRPDCSTNVVRIASKENAVESLAAGR